MLRHSSILSTGIFFFLFFFAGSFLCTMIPVSDRYFDKSTMRLLGKIKSAEMLKEEIKSLEDERAKLIGNNGTQSDIEELGRRLENLKRKRSSLFTPGNIGTLIARGIAGQNWEFLDDVPIDNVAGGLLNGVTVRASKALGDVLGDRIAFTLERTIGESTDLFINRFLEYFKSFYRFLFHNSQEPFTIERVKAWQELIRDSFEDIEKIMKDGLKDSLRSSHDVLRQFDVEKDQKNAKRDADENALENLTAQLQGLTIDQEIEQRSAWADLTIGYASLFGRFVEEIDRCIGYYDEGALEIFFAKQIKERLLKFGCILLKTGSLKDLDAALDSNKALIPAFKRTIDNLFKRLLDSITPRTYTSGHNAGGDRKGMRRKPALDNDDDDDDFPQPFSRQ